MAHGRRQLGGEGLRKLEGEGGLEAVSGGKGDICTTKTFLSYLGLTLSNNYCIKKLHFANGMFLMRLSKVMNKAV